MLLVLVVSLAALSDVTAAPRATPAWVPKCVAALERARDEFARPRGERVRITTQSTPTEDHRPCAKPIEDSVNFELPWPRDQFGNPSYSGGIVRRESGRDRPTAPWETKTTPREVEHTRIDAGRTAWVSALVEARDAASFS